MLFFWTFYSWQNPENPLNLYHGFQNKILSSTTFLNIDKYFLSTKSEYNIVKID